MEMRSLNKRLRKLGLSLMLSGAVGLGATTMAVAQEGPQTLEEAVSLLQENSAQLNTWQADFQQQMNFGGRNVTTFGTVKTQGNLSNTWMRMDMLGAPMDVKTITDATGTVWVELDMMGTPMVMTMDTAQGGPAAGGGAVPGMGALLGGAGISSDPEQLLELLQSQNFEFRGTEEIDGEETYVFAGQLGEEFLNQFDLGQQMQTLGVDFDRMILWVGTDYGFTRKVQFLSAAGLPVMTMTYKNFTANPTFEPGTFQYSPPADAQVTDMRQALGGGLASSGRYSDPPAPSAPSQPAARAAAPAEPAAQPAFYEKFQPGDEALDFTAPGLNQDTISLADYEGKVVLLDFWASWNKSSIDELPAIIKTWSANQNADFQVIGVSLDSSEEQLRQFLEEHPDMTWPQVFDGKGWQNQVAQQYAVSKIPYRLLIDKNGIVRATDVSGAELQNKVGELLAR